MSKIILSTVGSISQNPTSATTTINANDAIIQTAFDNTLSRDGTSPNVMEASLDMNNNHILNLPPPVNPSDPVRLTDVTQNFAPSTAAAVAAAAAAATSATNAATSATSSATSATNAATSATNAATTYTNFNNQYLGSKSSDPAVNNTGGALVSGNLYWNSSTNALKVYNGAAWVLYTGTLAINKPLYTFTIPAAYVAKTLLRDDIYPYSSTGSSGVGTVRMTRTPTDVWNEIVRRDNVVTSYAYVDPVNGSDGNAGTQASPYKTLQYAFSTSTATNIVGIPTGVFDPLNWNGGSTAAFYKRLSFLGPAVIGNSTQASFPDISAATWTVTSGAVYQTTLSGLSGLQVVQRFVRMAVFGTDGLPVRFAHYSSLAALQAASNGSPSTINGWFYDSVTKNLYVAFSNFNVNSFKSQFKAYYVGTGGDTGFLVVGGVYLFIDTHYGLTFDGCSLQCYNLSSSLPNVFIEGRRMVNVFAANANGVYNAGGLLYASGVTVEASSFDAFHGDPNASGTETLTILHDCVGNYAGDQATYATDGSHVNNCNGVSVHGGANTITSGCSFSYNYGPNVADTGTDGFTSLSWYTGVETQKSADGVSAGFVFAGSSGSGLRNAWLDSCSSNEEVGSITTGQGTVKTTNCSFNSPVTLVLTGGSISSYVRNAP